MTQRRFGNASVPRDIDSDIAAARSDSDRSNVIDSPSAHQAQPPPSSAAIGSINIDAVFDRYKKVAAWRKKLDAAHAVRKNELTKLQSEAQMEKEMISKLQLGSVDHEKHSARLTDLKARYEAGREQSEREFNLRHAEAEATIYKEIQNAVAALAQAKGLTYVVKASPTPRPDADHSEVSSALQNSVIYADPRNDLTEEVIGELNHRFNAAGERIK